VWLKTLEHYVVERKCRGGDHGFFRGNETLKKKFKEFRMVMSTNKIQ